MKYLLLLIASTALLCAETYPVIHKKNLWPDGKGTVEIGPDGIRYTAQKEKDNRNWTWLDIQYFERISPKEFVVLTYQDQRRYLGRDKEYRFVITQGELSDAVFASISKNLERPVTDKVAPKKVNALYSIPVKHEHTLGGCEGKLEFTGDSIYFVTDHAPDVRTWRMDRDIVSVWSDDPYRLEIRAYDNNRREFSRTATYKFDLKRKLDPAFYRELKLKLYNLEANGEVIR